MYPIALWDDKDIASNTIKKGTTVLFPIRNSPLKIISTTLQSFTAGEIETY